MRSLPYKTLALIFIVIFTASIFVGWYVFSDPVDSPDVSLGDSENLENANRNASIPPWALKWAEGLQNVDAQERMRRLAEVRRAAGNPRLDVQQRWQNRMKVLGWDLLETAARYDSPEAYIGYIVQNPRQVLLYHRVIAMIYPEQIPLLCDMLNDEAYADSWHNIARVIGWVGDNEVAVDTLLEYLQRDDINNLRSTYSRANKLYSLALIGNTEFNKYDELLRQAAGSVVGAEKLAQNWIDDPGLEKYSSYGDQTRESSLRFIRSGALSGLVFSGRPENIDYVRQLYQDELQRCKDLNKKSRMLSHLIDARAFVDYIEENGKDQLQLEISLGPPLYFIPEYLKRYTWSSRIPEP